MAVGIPTGICHSHHKPAQAGSAAHALEPSWTSRSVMGLASLLVSPQIYQRCSSVTDQQTCHAQHTTKHGCAARSSFMDRYAHASKCHNCLHLHHGGSMLCHHLAPSAAALGEWVSSSTPHPWLPVWPPSSGSAFGWLLVEGAGKHRDAVQGIPDMQVLAP
eukprot:361273-Chlamydomonas_euryale.AAC.1